MFKKSVISAVIIIIAYSIPVFADLNQQFADAAYKGNLKLVQSLLSRGADINAKKYKTPALSHAIQSRHKEVARYLIDKGADVNARDHMETTPLWWAVHHGIFDLARLMIEKGGDINIKTKRRDSILGLVWDINFLKYLISKGALVTRKDVIKACKIKDIGIMKILLDSEAGKQALKENSFKLLYTAVSGNRASGGEIKKVKLLLSKGANFDPKSEEGAKLLVGSAFHNDDPAITKLILSRGVDVNSRAYDDQTALIIASGYGHPMLVSALLNKGADVNAVNDMGTTALIKAAKRSAMGKKDRARYRVMELLLKAGPNINASEESGWTALHYAATIPNYHAMTLLLSNGADINARDKKGKTLLKNAYERKAEFSKTPYLKKYTGALNRVIQYLKRKGAKQ